MKKDIEANFKQMKQSLVVEEGSRHEPQLAAHYINWWVQIQLLSCWWWLMQQLSDDNHMLLSVQDIRPNSKLNIGGVDATGGADRRPSPGRDLHVTVPVLTDPDQRLCICWILTFCWSVQELLNELMLLWLWKGATQFDSADRWWDWIALLTNHVGFYIVLLNVAHMVSQLFGNECNVWIPPCTTVITTVILAFFFFLFLPEVE